tara:strand:- start:224 stop:391 length:168 start_codon:yes stop_codon:yes gene_type:complete
MISIHKLSTNLSSKEAQILNKMELIKTTTDMVEFLHEKTFRDLGSGFVVVQCWVC